eukprot:11648735-Ditylum_brightwellii.AAC.1
MLPQRHPSCQTTKHCTTLIVAIPLHTSPAAASTSSSSHKDHLAAQHLKDCQCYTSTMPWQCLMPNVVLNIIVKQKTCKSVEHAQYHSSDISR